MVRSQKVQNIKFLTPLQMKQVPYAYLNQVYKKAQIKGLKKDPDDFLNKNV